MATEKQLNIDHDVLIIGAGISGINAAYRIQTESPNLRFTIFEGRERLGGTWDLFKYPGLRSDSDLYTFGFAFEPWVKSNPIADGDAILAYLNDTVKKYHIDEKIRYQHKVTKLNWRSSEQRWEVDIHHAGETVKHLARFVVMGTGYYDYDQPLEANIPGIENFQGPVVHPQFWPEDLNYTDKKIAIIGSGATAVTLVASLSKKASHVTQIQRSPGYFLIVPMNDPINNFFRDYLPTSMGQAFIRWKNILFAILFWQFCRLLPNAATNALRKSIVPELPESYPTDPHFKPTYAPWDQRMCIVPGGNFFEPIRQGKASIQTGQIEKVTKDGVVMKSGETVAADIVVTATGLKMKVAGGAQAFVDDKPIVIADKFLWKGTMIQDVPNLFYIIGYANASWTLAADAAAQLITRMINKMDSENLKSATPRASPEVQKKLESQATGILPLKSTYVTEAEKARIVPRAATFGNWKPRSNYIVDIYGAWYGNIRDGLEFR